MSETPRTDERARAYAPYSDAVICRKPLVDADFARQLERELAAARVELAEAQAKIDRLMLEYCPDEMTTEQIAEWERHQRPVSSEQSAAIDAALDAGEDKP